MKQQQQTNRRSVFVLVSNDGLRKKRSKSEPGRFLSGLGEACPGWQKARQDC